MSDFGYTCTKQGDTMELDKRITIRLSTKEHKKLTAKADKKGITLSTLIRQKLSKK